MVSQNELKNFLELSQMWQAQVIASTEKKLKRKVNIHDKNDLFLLAQEAKNFRRKCDWPIYTNQNKRNTPNMYNDALAMMSKIKINRSNKVNHMDCD